MGGKIPPLSPSAYTMATHDPSIFFDISDYSEAYWDDCLIVIASRRTIDLCLSSLRTTKFYNTRWYNGDTLIVTDVERAAAIRFAEIAIAELNMACSIETDLGRIATALEAIQAVVEGTIQVSPQNGYLKPYVDQIEDVLQEAARAIGGVTVPVDEVP